MDLARKAVLNLVKVTSCRLIGCQSHEDTTFEFVDGLNVIVATNNTGKSVFMKMIKIACHPKAFKREDLKYLIRWGHECATAMYTFSDGSAGAVKVYPNRVVYFFTPKMNEVGFVSSLEPDRQFVHNLSVLVDSSEVFFGNVIDLDQALLLVESSDKANNNLIELAINDPRINFLIKNFKERSEEYKKASDELARIIVGLDYKVDKMQYVDVDTLEVKVDIFEAGVHVLDKLIEVGRELNDIGTMTRSRDFDFLISLTEFYLEASNNLENLMTSTKDYDETLINSLDVLCSCNIEELIPVDSEKSLLLDTALELTKAYDQVGDLKVSEFSEDLVDLVEVFQALGTLRDSALELSITMEQVEERSKTISDLESKINSMGQRVPCVIYGEVQHIDGNCIPVSNGFTSNGG